MSYDDCMRWKCAQIVPAFMLFPVNVMLFICTYCCTFAPAIAADVHMCRTHTEPRAPAQMCIGEKCTCIHLMRANGEQSAEYSRAGFLLSVRFKVIATFTCLATEEGIKVQRLYVISALQIIKVGTNQRYVH